MLLASAPKQVTFVALRWMEAVEDTGYMCHYTVAQDPEDPRDYEWRCDRIDLRRLEQDGNGASFWEGQREVISGRETPEARLWVERKHGEHNGVEFLLEHYCLGNEFFVFFRERLGWDPDDSSRGVVTLLPEEIEKRPAIAHELLIKHLQKKGDG